LDTAMLETLSKKFKFIFTVEEGIIEGGFGSQVESAIASPVNKIGLPREFITHGKRDILLDKFGLSANAIAAKISEKVCLK